MKSTVVDFIFCCVATDFNTAFVDLFKERNKTSCTIDFNYIKEVVKGLRNVANLIKFQNQSWRQGQTDRQKQNQTRLRCKRRSRA